MSTMNAEIKRRQISQERVDELQREYRKAQDAMLRRVASEAWLIPPACADRIAQLLQEPQARKDTWFEELDEDGSSLNRATRELREIVRKDLGPKPLPLDILNSILRNYGKAAASAAETVIENIL